MGRYCDDLDGMKDSGELSTAILKVIGENRYNDSWFSLNHDEVRLILFEMGETLDKMQAITNGALSYQDIWTKATGYNKLARLMLWWNEHHQGDKLNFA